MGRSGWRGTTVLLVLLGIATAVAGCSADEPAGPFPDRPRDIDVSRLDPCDSLTEQQLGSRGLGTGTPGTATVNGATARDCTWIGSRIGAGVQFIPLGADAAATESGSRMLLVAGFGAVEGAPETNNGPGLPAFCQIAVDAGPQQTVRVQINNGRPDTGGDPQAIRDVCRQAEDVAEAVLTTIGG